MTCPILSFGSEEQKQHWLPRLQQGTALGCFGLTEPNFGSNSAGMRTTAVRDGSGFVLNGENESPMEPSPTSPSCGRVWGDPRLYGPSSGNPHSGELGTCGPSTWACSTKEYASIPSCWSRVLRGWALRS